MPPSFSSYLKCIEVSNYDGFEDELFALKILLKNAIAFDELVATIKKDDAENLVAVETLYK